MPSVNCLPMVCTAGPSGSAVCCRCSSADIVGSNPTRDMDIRLLWMLRVVRQRSLRQANHSSRADLPIVVGRWVWTRNLVNEEAPSHRGLWRQIKKLYAELIKQRNSLFSSTKSSINWSRTAWKLLHNYGLACCITCWMYLSEFLLELTIRWLI